MTKPAALLGLALIVPMLACDRFRLSVTPEHPYQPLRMGATWEYVPSPGPTGGGALQTPSMVVRVEALQRDVHEVRATRSVQTPYVRAEGPISITAEGVMPELPPATPANPFRLVFRGGVVLPADVRPGQRWSYAVEYVTRNGGPLQTAVYRVAATAVGIETITVPAGTYAALHVHRVATNRVSAEPPPGLPATPPVEAVMDEDVYYARGVGMIATQSTSAFQTESYYLQRYAPGG